MQDQRPKRGQRRRHEVKELGKSITNFKEFISSKLQFKLPQDYAEMSNQKKRETWVNLLKQLKNQTQKVSYQLPDNRSLEEVNLIIEAVNQQNSDGSLDYEYEEMFLGNKKQLIIYKKCRQMDEYLQKYRLPKTYESSLKEAESVAKLIFQAKIQRNVAISQGNKSKINQLNQQMKKIEEKFASAFGKFSSQMRKIFQHFKCQKKRTVINLQIVRESIYQKLKPIAHSLQLDIFPRYPDTDHQEFLYIQVTKKNQFDKYFDVQQNEESKNEKNQELSDESSFVSDLSDQEKELEAEELKRKALPPAGVHSIRFQKYDNLTLSLKVSFEVARNKFQTPNLLQFSTSPDEFEFNRQISSILSDIFVEVPVKKGGFISVYFRTKNDAGISSVKNFRYFLNLDQNNYLKKNGTLFFIGEDKYLIPAQRSRKQGDFQILTLAVNDVSISSTHVQICDADGNSADWGLFKKVAEKKEQVVQSNQFFHIVNNSNNMVYQEPAIRLEKYHKIIKSSSGPGYSLLLDAYGAVWVYGKNNCGQLGTKEEMTQDEPIKLKFFQENKTFITDLKASQSLASFAIDSNGTLYKWGMNQFFSTAEPIYDRFGKVINYSLSNYFEEQWTPLAVKKHFETEKIIQIQAGNEFYLMLNNEGTLYGWGQCRNLGKGTLKDGKDEQIQNICNDIQIMNNVLKVSAGRDHAVVLTNQGKIIGWGNMQYLSNTKKDFSETVVDLTGQYGQLSEYDQIVCGPCYTCIYKAKEGRISLFGQTKVFTKSEFTVSQKIRKIQCSNSVIGILCEKEDAKGK